MKKTLRRGLKIVPPLVILGVITLMIGCVRNNGGVWYFKEAKLPTGWPELTPVGRIQVKQYPAYRQAIATDQQADPQQGKMFNALFKHIQTNDIAMTAPVDMTYDDTPDRPTMQSMAFLYDIPERGPVGQDGKINIIDVPPRTVVSIGVRGRYNDTTIQKAVGKLRAYLAEHVDLRPVGPPRMLGYNSPFIPYFWRYAEVQIPVEAAE